MGGAIRNQTFVSRVFRCILNKQRVILKDRHSSVSSNLSQFVFCPDFEKTQNATRPNNGAQVISHLKKEVQRMLTWVSQNVTKLVCLDSFITDRINSLKTLEEWQAIFVIHACPDFFKVMRPTWSQAQKPENQINQINQINQKTR
ncbi:hypothetical protein K501DRAFT_80189 [Backusella circina FSU 941]|nr:hypothetical protein K501DRAFT_80189 [Backusella circina FSU 941]